MFMAGTLTEDPVQLYFDCAGTLAAARGPPAAATGPAHRLAHLWGHIFCRFDGACLKELVHKTLGHATAKDVDLGLTTWWEKRANGHADRFAKMGARAHGFTAENELEVQVLSGFQVRLARHIGEVAAWLADNKIRDTVELVGSKLAKAVVIAEKGNFGTTMLAIGEVDSKPGREACAAALAADALSGHSLRVASCLPPVRGAVLICTKCGGYSGKRLCLLGKPCRGQQGRSHAAGARIAAFGAGRHPFEDGVRLGGHWPPPVSVSGWLLGRWGVGGASGAGRLVPSSSAGPPGSFGYRAKFLAALGLSEALLQSLVAEAAEAKAEKRSRLGWRDQCGQLQVG